MMIKSMNSKMRTNSPLSTTKPKNSKTKTKQTTRTGTDSQKQGLLGCYQWGSERGIQGEKVQRTSSINGGQKIDRGRVRIVKEMQKPKNL